MNEVIGVSVVTGLVLVVGGWLPAVALVVGYLGGRFSVKGQQ